VTGAGILRGLRVVEGSAFVAAPLGGMTLAQLGAEVIRFDQIGGGLDHQRWPLADDGQSLFWAGLNKGKRSIQLDLRSDEGRELAMALVTAPGAGAGLFLTNFPARGWLRYDALRERRNDLVMVALTGNPDGTSEVDYTINPATGFPWATGPRNLAAPLNSVLPAWDVAMGTLAAAGLLAAERHRTGTGEGQLVRLSLSDVAFAMVGNLGRIAEAQLGGRDQPKDGNYLYGAFGHDFETQDGRRVMVVALTARQWHALKDATGIGPTCETIEQTTGHDLSTESGRFEARDLISALLRPWFAARDLAAVRESFGGTGVSWGPYPDLPPARHRGRALLDSQPHVRGSRAPRPRQLPHARFPARFLRGRARARAPSADPRRAHGADPGGRPRAEPHRDRPTARRRHRRRPAARRRLRPHEHPASTCASLRRPLTDLMELERSNRRATTGFRRLPAPAVMATGRSPAARCQVDRSGGVWPPRAAAWRSRCGSSKVASSAPQASAVARVIASGSLRVSKAGRRAAAAAIARSIGTIEMRASSRNSSTVRSSAWRSGWTRISA
jgi:2-methylfumaryl-CoA isomerase